MTERYRIVITDDVFARLDEIFTYIALDQQSPQNAQRVIDRLVKDIYSLEFMPHRCAKVRTKRFTGGVYRKLISKPYVTVFRIDDRLKAVYVVSIRHGAQKQQLYRFVLDGVTSPTEYP
jgi:toxin ParE1/3/4